MQGLAKNLLVVFALSLLVGYFAQRFPQTQKGRDFADFYIAARMVHDGRGAEIYDPLAQDEYLKKYAGRVGTYFIHPPFETLIYLPFALFPLYSAYALWCCANATLLGATAALVSKYVLPRWNWRILLSCSLVFVPLLLNFMQGQDSLILLFLPTLALVAAEQKSDLAAGCILACGLFKFHLVLPVALLTVARASRKMAGGFIAVAGGLMVLSAGISGWNWPVPYAGFLRQVSGLPLAGMNSSQMANLRGLVSVVVPGSPRTALWLTVLGSLLVLYFALPPRRNTANAKSCGRLIFANAILAAILIGYHLSPHDLTLLLLPMALILHHLLSSPGIPDGSRIWLFSSLGVLALPPAHLWFLHLHLYAITGALILLLFAATRAEISRLAAREGL
jgi:alpha-1,2-mannosyltransferase